MKNKILIIILLTSLFACNSQISDPADEKARDEAISAAEKKKMSDQNN